MVIARIETRLKAAIGLAVASIGSATLERAVRERVIASGCKSVEAYLDLVLTSDLELQELIEAVVVPESWFFRDRNAFVALGRLAYEECLRRSPDATLRALSLPCSTGEEPYSIAMALLDAGVPPQRFQIDAVDISLRALARGDSGIYGKNSFRDKDLSYRDRYFMPMGSGYCLSEDVRRQVRFRQGNLFDAGDYYGAQSFDVIFCRNVLIYFDRPTQVRAIEILKRLLTNKGLLFVAPSETGALQEQGWVTAKLPLAFAFRKDLGASNSLPCKSPRKPKSAPQVRSIIPMPLASAKAQLNAAAAKPVTSSSHAPAPSPCTPEVSKNWIEEAQEMANQGNLAEALAYCERHMRQDAPSAEAFYVLGLLHDATGRTQQACEQYRKALYLDPGHAESLVHLAEALRSEGDTRGAQLLLDRAKRAQATGNL